MTTPAPTTSPDPRAVNPHWPWAAVADPAAIWLRQCWVCGRHGGPADAQAVVRLAEGGADPAARFIVPLAKLGLGDVERIFGRGVGMGEATLLMTGAEANAAREWLRAGGTIPGPTPFVPRVPTAADLAYGASAHATKNRRHGWRGPE